MFTQIRKDEKGFTLIELLIVVAIIAILAAIAIPQFSAYRMRGYNAAANSDTRNCKTAEEAIFADRQSYGVMENAVLIGAANTIVADALAGIAGTSFIGPLAAAGVTTAGLAISTYIDTNNDNVRDTTVRVGVSASSQDVVSAGTAGGAFGQSACMSEHRMGNRAFSSTSGGTAVCYAENEIWSTNTVEVIPEATAPALYAQGCQAQASGGAPIATWVAL